MLPWEDFNSPALEGFCWGGEMQLLRAAGVQGRDGAGSWKYIQPTSINKQSSGIKGFW